jgi:hypothetical protein
MRRWASSLDIYRPLRKNYSWKVLFIGPSERTIPGRFLRKLIRGPNPAPAPRIFFEFWDSWDFLDSYDIWDFWDSHYL